MADSAADGSRGVYPHNHEVDDRSISAPPVLELTAKVALTACQPSLQPACLFVRTSTHCAPAQRSGPVVTWSSPLCFLIIFALQTLFSFWPPLVDIRCDDKYEQFYESAQVSLCGGFVGGCWRSHQCSGTHNTNKIRASGPYALFMCLEGDRERVSESKRQRD